MFQQSVSSRVVLGTAIILLWVGIAVWCALAAPGCTTALEVATSPQTYAALNDTFIAGVTVLIAAKKEGEFTDQEWVEDILPVIVLGNDLLEQYDLTRKTRIDTPGLLGKLHEVMTALRPYVARTYGTPTPLSEILP